MKTPDIDIDHLAIDILIVAVVFLSMRLLYGYWPWRQHPQIRTMRKLAYREREPEGNFNFQPVTPNGADHFDRSFVESDNDKTQSQRDQQKGVADTQADGGSEKKEKPGAGKTGAG